jgi:type IV pilus assembly protein PilW
MTHSRSHRGFTLIEIMVGLVIGLIATVIIFQVFAVAERQKRTTTGTSDAQGNGAIAMFMLERHLKMAGAGLNHDTFGQCTTMYTYDDNIGGPIDANGGASLFAVASITDGGVGPDSVTVLYYDNPTNADFRFSSTVLSESTPDGSPAFQTFTARNCAVGNMALMQQGGDCMLMTVTGVTPSSGTILATINHAAAPAGRYNPSLAVSATWPSFQKNQTTLQCFGGLFRVSYGINTEQLEVTEPDPAAPLAATITTAVVPSIVNFQAQYGIEDATLVPPIAWVDATGADWGTPSLVNVRRIVAVRIALLARNDEYQKPPASGTCDATTPAAMAQWPAWAGLGANLAGDALCYRYKVVESTVPLRNILWAR